MCLVSHALSWTRLIAALSALGAGVLPMWASRTLRITASHKKRKLLQISTAVVNVTYSGLPAIRLGMTRIAILVWGLRDFRGYRLPPSAGLPRRDDSLGIYEAHK